MNHIEVLMEHKYM